LQSARTPPAGTASAQCNAQLMRLQRAPRYRRPDHGITPPFGTTGGFVPPLLIINPRSDVRFVQLVAELTASGSTDPADLQSRLRAEFPDAIVRRRELSSEATEMWYVYRDGRWSPD
jgi:hypothetical protein